MKKIKDFRIDRNLDSLDNVKKIKSCIDEFVYEDTVKDLSSNLSNLLEIPSEIINKKIKQVIYDKFDYYANEPKFKIDFTLFESLKYFAFFIILVLFKKNIKLKNNKKEKVDIILDNVEKEYVVEKFGKILSYFKKPLILVNKSFTNKNTSGHEAFFLNINSSFLSNNILKGKTISSLRFIFRLFYFSQKNKLNLIKIFFTIFYSSLKYYKIFSSYDSKFLIHDRIYHSCAIRNYLFKKNGGNKILCLQSHIAEGTISVFCDIDTLLTFGKENDTEKKLKLLGGTINSSAYVGSIRMEEGLKNTKIINEINPIDILITGINIANWVGTSKEILNIYYEHIRWISKISKKYPKLKITIKHHPNYRGDATEKEIIKNTNINTIVKPENKLNSYHFLLKSKLILSFGSTMIIEGRSLGKQCFFLDPEKKNSTFFNNLDYLNEIRISNFEDLEKIVKKCTIDNESNMKIENEKFCLSHENASERVYKYLSKFEKHENKNF